MFRKPLSIFALTLALSACAPKGAYDRTPDNRITTTPPQTSEQSLPGSEPAGRVSLTPPPAEIGAHSGPAPVVKIALLLPLSGESKALGQSMLDAATLALYDTYVSLPPDKVAAKVAIIPKDTGASAGLAADAATAALGQGAKLIVGPLFGNGVAAVAPIARKSGVPVLSFSNNKAVAQPGVYVLGFLPDQQVKRVAEYAALHKVAAVGALVPNDAYGKTVSDALTATLTPQGVRVSPVENYAHSAPNLDAALKRLREAYDKTPFQGLMLAEGGDMLPQVLTGLKALGMDSTKVRFLGTGVWDDEEILANPNLKGAWLAAAPPQYYASFVRRFTAAYGYKPKRLAALAYDAVILAAQLALTNAGGNYTDEMLTAPGGFMGPANGLYRLMQDGTSMRAQAVMEIGERGLVQLEAAPAVLRTE